MSREAGSRVGWPVALASLVGLAGFFYPFFLSSIAPADEAQARASDAPLLFAAVTILALVSIVAELDVTRADRGAMAAKTVALLGVLVATNAAVRLVPTFLGFSPFFILIVLVGAVFGPAVGFQMGALSMLVSAFITGGVGPWLPFQMLGAGWVGMTAGWIPLPASRRGQLATLALFGLAWGFLYGALLNLWSWPFTAPGVETDAGLYWSPGMGGWEAVQAYGRFYLVTSLPYDAFRAVGNAALILLVGGPLLATLQRYRTRLGWSAWEPADDPGPTIGPVAAIPAE